ncbi:MAG: hypothetical protein GQ529_07010 [Methyloprofundus sp.]|nr:hypothetical protein [Methyloprofundus sp.]
MYNKKEILKKRFKKLERHYSALKDYKQLIHKIRMQKDIFQVDVFQTLEVQEKAVLDAYLKRFSSIQDFLGAKIFASLLEISGISYGKMSEVLYLMEKEEIIDSLDNWIELREIRNELEHDYPENLQQALQDLKFCVDNFVKLESYYLNSLSFAKRYLNETF